MSIQLSASELEDAEYRARLAPLASSVLPRMREPPAMPPTRGPRMLLAATVAGATVLLLGVWLYPQPPAAVRVLAPPQDSHATAPAAATATGQPAPVPSVPLTGVLIERGHAAMAHRDITAARLLFQEAADAGSAAAAKALASTYDVHALLAVRARATYADPARATYWRRRAAELAVSDAAKPSSPGDGAGR